jgi:hypothetical protein|tara:strand:+ start:6894 stop:7118 length:225 start_codon:yes stop_codon:yes gene_type:complete
MIKMNSKTFSQEIETCVRKEKISYMDAIIHLCDQKDLDPGKVNSFINKQIKEKLKVEAINLKLLNIPKQGSLPV